MKNWKTTLVGLILAGLEAAEPVISGAGYHLDGPTAYKLSFAVLLAVFGLLAKDFDVTGGTVVAPPPAATIEEKV